MDMRDVIKSSGVRNFAKLLSANVVAQVIGLIVYPILTRVYAPEDFGLLNLFLSISGVLLILSTAELHYAIVLPKEETEGKALVHLSALILLVIVAITAFSTLFSTQIASLFNAPALAHYYWLMPLLVFAQGAWNILNYWYIRHKKYAHISGYQLSQSVLSSAGKIGLGYMGWLQGGMIYSTVFAPLLCILLSGAMAWKKRIKPLFVRTNNSIWQLARTYKNFPLFSLPRSFVNMFAGQLPVFLLTPVFGSEYVGYWSMALLLGFIPVSLITKSVYQVLYQHITNRVNSHLPIGIYFHKLTGLTIGVGLPLFVVLYFLLPTLTCWFLGEGWSETSTYIQWMLPWLLCSFLTGSSSFLSDVFFKQKIGFLFELLLAILRVVGVGLGMLLHDFSVAIAGYALGSAVAVLAQYVWLLTLVKKYDCEIVS